MEGDCDRGGKPWGFMAEGVTDAPACISNCQSSFLDKLAADNGSFDHICSYLSTDVRTENEDVDVAFWDLYCCDSQLCGVDHLDSKERDRTVPQPTLRPPNDDHHETMN